MSDPSHCLKQLTNYAMCDGMVVDSTGFIEETRQWIGWKRMHVDCVSAQICRNGYP